MTNMHNRKNLSVTVHAAANLTLTIAGNNSVSNIATGDEVLTGAVIKQVWWGSQTGAGYWNVLRGSNLVATYDSTGWHDYAGNGNMLSLYPAATLVLTLVGTANGFITLELQKIGVSPQT